MGSELLPLALLAKEVLGPTATKLGRFLADDAPGRVLRLCQRAKLKLRGVACEAEAKVPFRIAADSIELAARTDDELQLEYLAGMLASARTLSGLDDRATPLIATIKTSSSYVLKFHHLLYSLLRRFVKAPSVNIGVAEVCTAHTVLIPDAGFREYMRANGECPSGLGSHVVSEAIRLGLISDRGGYFSPDKTYEFVPPLDGLRGGGMLVGPSIRGAELWMHANGHGQLLASQFLDPTLEDSCDLGVQLPSATFVGAWPFAAVRQSRI